MGYVSKHDQFERLGELWRAIDEHSANKNADWQHYHEERDALWRAHYLPDSGTYRWGLEEFWRAQDKHHEEFIAALLALPGRG
jgi:hypothetical protein